MARYRLRAWRTRATRLHPRAVPRCIAAAEHGSRLQRAEAAEATSEAAPCLTRAVLLDMGRVDDLCGRERAKSRQGISTQSVASQGSKRGTSEGGDGAPFSVRNLATASRWSPWNWSTSPISSSSTTAVRGASERGVSRGRARSNFWHESKAALTLLTSRWHRARRRHKGGAYCRCSTPPS